LERVTNYDANFDRDNPLLSNGLTSSKDTKFQPLSNNNVNVSSIESPPSSGPLSFSSNVLSVLPSSKLPSLIKASPLSKNNRNNNNVLNHNNNNNDKASIMNKAPGTNLHPSSNNKNNNINALYNNNVGTTTGIKVTSESPLLQSITPPSMELPSLTSASSQLLTSKDVVLSSNQSPLFNNNSNNNNTVLNQNNNNNYNKEVSTVITVPVTSRATRTIKSKIPGMIHTGSITTEYDATLPRPNISIAHEETRSKYTVTENHVTAIPSTRSKISIAHEETSEFSSTRPYISVAHEEAVLKSSEHSSARSNISVTHESKYTGMNTKYATATDQSSYCVYTPTPINNDDPIDNNKSFCSHYLQTVMKITNNNNNNNEYILQQYATIVIAPNHTNSPFY
jgi:hypothetical protein